MMIDALYIRRQSIEEAVNQCAHVGWCDYVVTYIDGTGDTFRDPVRLLRILSLRDWHCTTIFATSLNAEGQKIGPRYRIYSSQ